MVLQGLPEDRGCRLALSLRKVFWASDTYLQLFNIERDIPRLATRKGFLCLIFLGLIPHEVVQ